MAQHPGPKPQSLARRIVAALRNQPFAPQAQPATRMPDLETWKMPHRAVDVKDWEVALNMANNVLRPDRTRLLDLYDSILVDNHTSSVMESRVLRVVRSKYKLVGSDGKPQPEKNKLLETQWFEDFLQYVAEAAFRGHTLIELSELAKPGQLKRITRIDARNVLPWTGVVVRRRGEETGYPYREEPLASYLIEVGQSFDLGLLSQVAPVVITKKYAIGSWSDFVEKFGIPPRWVKTPSTDKKRLEQLETMLQNMVSSAYGIIQGTEEIQVMQTPGVDAHKVFDELISRMNSEISKRILGQDGTSDNKDASGTYGSLKVLQGVAEDRHQADKASVMYVINEELFPRLIKLGYPLAGVRFEWDELRDLSALELVDAATKLGSVFEIDPEYMAERTGIKIIGIKRAPGEISDNGKGAPDNPDDPDNPSPPTDPTKPAVPSSVPIQETALNGAQVASLLQIITAVANGELPVEVARPLIRVAFPAVSEERITEMLNGMKDFKPPAPPDPPEPSGQKSGRQSGKKKGEGGTGDELDDDDEDEDGVTASWLDGHAYRCAVCGGRRAEVVALGDPLSAESIEELLGAAFRGEDWSNPYFTEVGMRYREGLLNTWQHDIAQLTYDAVDHAAAAAMEINIFRFSAAKTTAALLQMNDLVKESKGFSDFKRRVEESDILEDYNKRKLEAEHQHAVNVGLQTSRYYQLKRDTDAFPFWEYYTQGDDQVRPAHRALDRKVFRADDPIWDKVYPPNGWNCRCTVLPVPFEPAKVYTEAEGLGAMQAEDPKGYAAMQSGGFLVNRARTQEVFKMNMAYRNELRGKDPKAFAFGVEKSYGRKGMDFESFRAGLSERAINLRNNEEALSWFDRNSQQIGEADKRVMVTTDHAGRKIHMSREQFKAHLEGKHRTDRHATADLIPSVLSDPDEVWINEPSRKGAPGLIYVKFHAQGIMRVAVAAEDNLLRITTWTGDLPDSERRGLLIKTYKK